jgi:hypothetical protein
MVLLSGGERTEGDLGHVYGAESISLVDIPDEIISNLNTNGPLCLCLQ